MSGINVFSRTARFVGRIDGGTEVWNGQCQGEIVSGDLFLFRRGKSSVVRGESGSPGTPGIPGVPGSRGGRGLPAGFEDVELD